MNMIKRISLLCAVFLVLVVPGAAQVLPAPPMVNFQGRLANASNIPVPDGNYSLTFRLFNSATGGTLLWRQVVNPVAARNGVFRALLNFGSGFENGTNSTTLLNGNVWVEIQIGSDAPLTPRQQLVSVPYALRANSVADGSITGASIADGTITAVDLAPNTFNGLGWLLGGNSGVTNGFLGTTDNNPLELRVNNRRVMRYIPQETSTRITVNVLGGSELNEIAPNAYGATIAGGGVDFTNSVDRPNRVLRDLGSIGGGMGNTVDGQGGVIAGGLSNTAGFLAVVGGGVDNTASGLYSIVPGGALNTASGTYSFAAGFDAKALHEGTFVWADSTPAEFSSTGEKQFLIRAAGGVGINKNNPSAMLDVNGLLQATSFKLPTGAGNGLLLVSDASGNATWNPLPSNSVTNANVVSIDWSKITGVPASAPNGWNLNGNSATNAATQFVGTTDEKPLNFRVNNSRALRLEQSRFVYNAQNHYYESNNVLGGYEGNRIVSGVVGATIAGGGYRAETITTQGPVAPNTITARGGTISGGANNRVGLNQNSVDSANIFSTIAGGIGNSVEQPYGFIGGGQNNSLNNIESGMGGVIGGGANNWAAGNYSVIPGGEHNTASRNYSFAAGRRAKSLHDGTFVWADSANTDFYSSATNQFLIRATGGVGVNTSSPQATLHVTAGTANDAGGTLRYENVNSGTGPATNAQLLGVSRFGGLQNLVWENFGARIGMRFASNGGAGNVYFTSGNDSVFMTALANGQVGIGGSPLADFKLDVSGKLYCTQLLQGSDVRFKQNIVTLDHALDTILSLRGVTFDWKQQDFPQRNFSDGRQIGFIAQEVEKVLPELVTTDEKGYKSVSYANLTPVLVEAVKQQQRQIDAREKRLQTLEQENAQIKARNATLEAQLSSILQRLERLEQSTLIRR